MAIKINRPIVSARIIDRVPEGPVPSQQSPDPALVQQQLIDSLKVQLEHNIRLLEGLAAGISGAHQQLVASYKSQIARLAVEIARKILAQQVEKGHYQIEAIIEQALEKAPGRIGLTIHVSPQDWHVCRQIQQDRPDSPLAHLEFVPDPGLGPAQCIIETPKGLVKYLIDDQLAKVQQALESASSA
ncbi:MAG: FliH/SctL family protein [Sedimentisphaerales bacterium]|nr:FliH/SctL family protein [Sedimentisphaerales bacterium]